MNPAVHEVRSFSLWGLAVLLLTWLLASFLSVQSLAADDREVPAGPEKSAASTPAEERREEVPEKPVRRYARSSLTAFVDRRGVPTLTDRPERYRRDKNYKEITIHYDPIVVPGRYRNLSSADQYSAVSVAHLVKRYCRQYGLKESLVFAMIKAESNFNPYAVSRAGARGLMQLLPGTAADMGVTDIFDPAQNIAGGTQYIAKLLELFGGNLRLALAAYNAGPETVKVYGRVPPYPETMAYVRDVLAYERQFSAHGVGAFQLAKGEKPSPSFLPKSEKTHYTIFFHSGLTQRADNVVDADPYYYVQFQGQTRRIHKDCVAKVDEPA